MLPAQATSDAHSHAIGPLKVARAVGAARVTLTHGSHVHIGAHKPKAWPRPTNAASFVKETWVASTADEQQPVVATQPPMAVVAKKAKKKMDVQVVVDYVGHGVASDPPVLTPQLAPLEDSLTSVQSTEYALRYEWKHQESVELAVVGAAVLVVAMVVIVFARRQQRAFEEQQRVLEESSHQADNDLENGASVTRDEEADDGVGTPESEADPTVQLSEDSDKATDDPNQSPESVVEGCV